MAKLWSKHVGKTFFYSFEQTMKQNKHGGKEFLTGLPLVEDDGVEGGKLMCWECYLPYEGLALSELNFMDSRSGFIVTLSSSCIMYLWLAYLIEIIFVLAIKYYVYALLLYCNCFDI